jgi:hypothetical protein
VNPALVRLIGASMSVMPGLRPIFTTLVAGRDYGSQWVTFLLTNGFRLADMQPMLDELGLGGRLANILQVVGVALGGRFDIPSGAALVAFGRDRRSRAGAPGDARRDPRRRRISAAPHHEPAERPRELGALERFLEAFTPEDNVWPGRFSILGIRIGPLGPAGQLVPAASRARDHARSGADAEQRGAKRTGRGRALARRLLSSHRRGAGRRAKRFMKTAMNASVRPADDPTRDLPTPRPEVRAAVMDLLGNPSRSTSCRRPQKQGPA